MAGSTTPSAAPAPWPARVPRCPRYASLDHWRGLACLSVIAFHATLFGYHHGEKTDGWADLAVAVTARLWIGVPFFFVISGYCIAATADASRRRQSSVGDYFIRRLRRIVPPYWVCLALTVGTAVALAWLGRPDLLSQGLGSLEGIPLPTALTPGQWAGNLTLSETWRPNLAGAPANPVLAQMWTLCYEEQFYAVVGVLLLLCPRRLFLGAGLVTAAVIPLALLGPGLLGLPTGGFFFDGRWCLFAAGIGLYWALNHAGSLGRLLVFAALLLGAWYGYASGSIVAYEWGFTPPRGKEPLAAFLFALLLLLLHPLDRRLAGWRILRPLAFCGTICYSAYLVHYPIAFAVGHLFFLHGCRGPVETLLLVLPTVIALSLLAGWGFHLAVEKHFLNPPPKRPATWP